MFVIDIAARALARTRPRLRFSSTLRGDQEHLHDILDQAEDARSTSSLFIIPPSLTFLPALDDRSTQWQATGLRRKFAPGLVCPLYLLFAHV